ncbi:hypothetical protein D9M68_297970 [compost metagenome]|jgi:AcrR family transcriptional regulator|uniref:Membrane alanine aminopeptidase N n=2 Tax=Metapseudomonas TaxID=3236656 RepID=A0AAD1FGT5_METFU|nr:MULTISPECIES: TetR/AcrR family transcriptional regulator [Pseudomonas]ELS27732.1 Membrane alanine aminopeptidase N [Pseudomonas furukawaii]MBT8767096.1 TetR family transcriptional regulator [Pseudomonas boanensis]BAU75479.1 membrane alanine aminopeptidase N [Pseudomonas furukawaii]
MESPSPSQLLRQVALELFVDRSFDAVSLRQLATAIGMQVGSLYNHMDSKQSLLFELVEEYEADLLDTLVDESSNIPHPIQRLEAFVRAHIEFNLQHRQHHDLARRELRSLTDEQQSSIQSLRRLQRECLQNILQQGVAQQLFQPLPPEVAAHAILSMLEGATANFQSNVIGLFSCMVANAMGMRALPALQGSTLFSTPLAKDERSNGNHHER